MSSKLIYFLVVFPPRRVSPPVRLLSIFSPLSSIHLCHKAHEVYHQGPQTSLFKRSPLNFFLLSSLASPPCLLPWHRTMTLATAALVPPSALTLPLAPLHVHLPQSVSPSRRHLSLFPPPRPRQPPRPLPPPRASPPFRPPSFSMFSTLSGRANLPTPTAPMDACSLARSPWFANTGGSWRRQIISGDRYASPGGLG